MILAFHMESNLESLVFLSPFTATHGPCHDGRSANRPGCCWASADCSAPPEDPAAAEPAKKNKKQQLEDDIAEIKNAVYNQQVMTALIIKALKVPIPAEALITPTAANMDISNPTPDIKDFGEAPAGDEPAPPSGGDMPKQGSVASLLIRDYGRLGGLLELPKGLAKEFGF